MERFIGKPRGGTNKKEYHGFKIYGTTGETIEDYNANNNNDD